MKTRKVSIRGGLLARRWQFASVVVVLSSLTRGICPRAITYPRAIAYPRAITYPRAIAGFIKVCGTNHLEE